MLWSRLLSMALLAVACSTPSAESPRQIDAAAPDVGACEAFAGDADRRAFPIPSDDPALSFYGAFLVDDARSCLVVVVHSLPGLCVVETGGGSPGTVCLVSPEGERYLVRATSGTSFVGEGWTGESLTWGVGRVARATQAEVDRCHETERTVLAPNWDLTRSVCGANRDSGAHD